MVITRKYVNADAGGDGDDDDDKQGGDVSNEEKEEEESRSDGKGALRSTLIISTDESEIGYRKIARDIRCEQRLY